MGCPKAIPGGCHPCGRGAPGGRAEVPEEGCPPLPVVSKGAFGPPAPKAEPKFSAADPAQSVDTTWSFPSASLPRVLPQTVFTRRTWKEFARSCAHPRFFSLCIYLSALGTSFLRCRCDTQQGASLFQDPHGAARMFWDAL